MESVLPSLAQKIAVSHTAVVVIDMQNDYCCEGGIFAQSGRDMTAMYSLIPRLQRFLDKARKRDVPIVFVRTVKSEEDVSLPMKELRARRGEKGSICTKGTWGAEFVKEIQPGDNEIIIEKKRYSGFFKTDLDARLHDMGVTTLVMMGVATNVCVQATVQDGFMHDYFIVVPNDLVASSNEELHDKALLSFDRFFGTVTSSTELLRIWGDEA